MGVFSLTVSAHADLQLKLLRSFNISSIFNGSAEGCGDAAIDPAFDGTNVFVAGFRSTSGAGPVGILRIDNVLSLPSGSLSYGAGVTKIFGWNAAGVGRDTRMFYYDGYLYAGFGLGQGTNPDTAIVRLNPYGVVNQLWSGDGIQSLADVGVSRYDTIALDPGYAGSGPALAVGTLNIASQQAIRRVSLSAGMLLGTSNTVAPTYLRDIAFAPNGDVYMYRGSNDANDGIFKAVRTGVNSFDTPVRLIPFDTGNYQEHRVIYVPVSQVNPALPDLLVYNFRFSPTDPASQYAYRHARRAACGASPNVQDFQYVESRWSQQRNLLLKDSAHRPVVKVDVCPIEGELFGRGGIVQWKRNRLRGVLGAQADWRQGNPLDRAEHRRMLRLRSRRMEQRLRPRASHGGA